MEQNTKNMENNFQVLPQKPWMSAFEFIFYPSEIYVLIYKIKVKIIAYRIWK